MAIEVPVGPGRDAHACGCASARGSSGAGCGDDQRADTVLAITEACNNAIEHGYRGQGGTIRLTLEHRGGQARDLGRGRRPVARAAARPDARARARDHEAARCTAPTSRPARAARASSSSCGCRGEARRGPDAQPRLAPRRKQRRGARVQHVRRGRPAAPRGRDGELEVAEPARSSARRSSRRSARRPRPRAGRARRAGRAGRAGRSPRARRRSRARPRSRGSMSSAFGGRWPIRRPVGWLRQRTAGCRIASVTLRVSASPVLALAGVEAELHPVELGRARRRAGRASRRGGCRPRRRAGCGTARAARWRPRSPRPGGAARRRRGPGRRATFGVWSQIARYSWPSSRAASAHLEHRRLAVRPGRVAVQVAADVGELDEARRLDRERRLAQLGRAPRHAERGVDAPPRRARPAAGRAPRRTRRCRSRARARCRSAPARRDEQLDRHALDRDADRAALGALDDARRSAAARSNASSTGAGSAAATTTASSLRRVDPAARVARDLAAERGRDRADELARLGQQRARRARPRLGPAASAVEHLALGRRPDARAPSRSAPARAAARNSSAVRHAERRARSPASASARARSAGRARSAPAAASRSSSSSSAIRPVSTSSREPRRDPRRRCPAARARARRGRAPSTGDRRLAHRLGRAAVGPRGEGVRVGELEQRRERLEPLGDRRVVRVGGHASADSAAASPSTSACASPLE